MGKFKVGDRVRCIDSEGTTCVAFGREYEVTEAYGRFVLLKNVFGGMYQHRFEIIESAPTITIEPGKHYRLRNGKVTGRVSQGDIGFEALVDGQVKVFDKAGGAVFGGEDIVEAWVPKVGERVRYDDHAVRGEGIVHSTNDDDAVDGIHYDWLVTVEAKDREFAYYASETCRKFATRDLEPLLVAAPAQPAVDGRATLTLMVTADTAQAEAAFDRIIGKLERIAELQEQLGLRAA